MWSVWKIFRKTITKIGGAYMEKLIFCFNHCDWILEKTKEIKALLNFKSVEIVRLNRGRAIAAIDSVMESLTDLKKTIEKM